MSNSEMLQELREIKQAVQNLSSQNKSVLSFSEFCGFADLSEDYVRKLHGERKIPFYRPFGKKLYITREDAIAVLKQNQLVHMDENERQAIHSLFTSKNISRGNI